MAISIRFKLFLSFILIIVIGYFIIVFFLTETETKVLKKRAINQLKIESEYSIGYIKEYIEHITNEIDFLSSLEIMDDLIVDDLDKRVTNLLEKKRDYLNEKVDLIALNSKKEVVSFTKGIGPIVDNELISKVGSKRGNSSNYLIHGDSFVFISEVHSSFEKEKKIGWVLIFIPLQNLKDVLKESSNLKSWIIPPNEHKEQLSHIFKTPDKKVLEQEYIYLTNSIGKPLNGWKVGYAVEKKVAFKTIEEVKDILLFAFIVMFVLVGFLTYIIDKHIVEPVRRLAEIASKIVKTNDYTLKVHYNSNDEVGKLSYNFNMLMDKTKEAFVTIEKRNKEYAKALEGLMNLFSQMIQSQTKKETIQKACKELKSITEADSVVFKESEDAGDGDIDKNSISLKCSFIGQGEKKEYGTILINGAKRSIAMRTRFFEAAEKIISLQIEKIDLLETTQEALKSKSSFFSALSHELKTPLGSILSLTQYLMTSSECNEKATQTLGKIESSASHLLQIINDILLMAKAETGALIPSIQSCDIKNIVTECIQMLEPLAEAKGLDIKQNLPNLQIKVSTDPKLVRHAVINLLANSIKYTYRGYIEISIKKSKEKIDIVVKDTGIGIEKNSLDKIFDEFYREYRAQSHEAGSGLGLPLCKAIANSLGAELIIKSEGKNRGTTAKFTLFLNSGSDSSKPDMN